jgi:D-aspartate ligase
MISSRARLTTLVDPPAAAVVVGLDTMQGLQTARILSRHGVRVLAITSDGAHHSCRTNVCEEIIVASSRSELLSALHEIAGRESTKPVLYPCLDGKVLTISGARDELIDEYEIVLPPHDIVQSLMDKRSFFEFATERGLPIPTTFVLDTSSDIETIAAQIDYPCVLKPTYRTKAWTAHTTAKAFKIESAPDLVLRFTETKDLVDELILQRWIPGSTTDLYSYNCYYDREGFLLAGFVARKIRQWPVDTGQSSLGEECREDRVEKYAQDLFAAVSYRGLGYVELKHDREADEFLIVEPNIGRPTGRSAIAEAGGVEILLAMYCDATGIPAPKEWSQSYSGVKWVHLRRDTMAAITLMRRGDLTTADWLRSLRGRKSFAVWSLRDPLPFVFDVVDSARSWRQR